MKTKKTVKGEFDYPIYERRRVTLRTVAYFAISIAVYVLGYVSTGSRENLLTIVAVLGLLPSSKSLVSLIMYMRIPKFSSEIYGEISEKTGNLSTAYSLFLTSYKKNFPINCFAVRGGNIIGFSEFESCDGQACEKHIKDILNQNSIKNVTVKIFKEKHRFIDRLAQLDGLEESGREGEILELLGDISL